MIYSVNPQIYPTADKMLEEITYHDENMQEWRICRIENGFFVRYFGIEYFKETNFSLLLKSGKCVAIKNTGCIFFQDTDFETFAEMRNIIKLGYTDEIWDSLQEFFTERFEHDFGIIESEIV